METNAFLFVGNQLALDFLNTHPVLGGDSIELLPDGRAVAGWLRAAGLLGDAEARRLAAHWADAPVRPLMEYREALREAVLLVEDGKAPPAPFLQLLNELLRKHPQADQVALRGGRLERVKVFHPERPVDALAPVAAATADLLTLADFSRVRKCPNCVLHFYDTSKKGTRRWCSMATCGNRSKVAAYAQRKKEQASL